MGDSINHDWAVEQTAPVGPQVYRALRDRIIRAELEPGAQVSESEIARAFSISRQPVREAFIKLADDGLVEVRPQRGTMVRKISIASVMDARFVREAVEADIVKLVAQKADATLVAELKRQIEAQRKLPPDTDAFMPMDEVFHRTLAEAADKEDVWKLVQAVRAQMDRVRRMTLLDPSIVMRAVDDHARVVEAIERRDVAAADIGMRTHMRQILRDIPAMLRARPEYFETIDLQANAA